MQEPARAEDALAEALPPPAPPAAGRKAAGICHWEKQQGGPRGESRERRGKEAPSCKGKDDRCSEEAGGLRILAARLSAEPRRLPGAWQPPPPASLSLGAAPPS